MAEGSGAPSGYRAHLDGLRAVAVYLVVAFHAGIGPMAGGFIGVDVFFVLSGYLVTQVLLRDLDGRGSVELGRFYSRRFRRLLPAAMVTIVATLLVYGTIATPAELVDARGGIQAASLWVANWYFIAQATDYFAADSQLNPVLHYWSLSIEEQFYLVWPLLLGGLARVTRGRRAPRRALQIVVLVGALASVVAALVLARSNLARAYYGTDTRAYQLLAGALVALTPGIVVRFRRRITRGGGGGAVAGAAITWAGLLGLALIASSAVDVGAVTRGVLATAAALVVVIGLEGAGSSARRVLSSAPAVYLGRVSYGTYLWHWIVILVLGARLDLSPVATALVAAAVATGLASLSYQLLELPVRTAPSLDRLRRPTIAVGLAISLLVGLVAVPRLVDAGADRRPVETASSARPAVGGAAPVPADLDWRAAAKDHRKMPACEPDAIETCTLVDGGSPHVLLLGDSNAAMYRSAFEALAEERGFTLSGALAPGCLWPAGIQRADNTETVGTFGVTAAGICEGIQDLWYRRIVPAIDPDIVVLVHRALDDPAGPVPLMDQDEGPLDTGTPAELEAIERRARAVVDDLRSQGRKVVIVEPAPMSTDAEDQVKCLSAATYLDECRFVSGTTPTPIERLYRRMADEDPEVWTFDVDRAQCPYLPICDPVVDGVVVRWSPGHLTDTFARTLAEPFGELFDANGLLR